MDTRFKKLIKSRHIFKTDQDFICGEVLFVSSGNHESGYKIRHKNNKGEKNTSPTLADEQILMVPLNQERKRRAQSW